MKPEGTVKRGLVDATVLVVEDDESVRAAFLDALRRAGYRTEGVATIEEAQRAIEAPHTVFEAAVVDFQLPDGTAPDLVAWLIDRDVMCRSVVVTGEAGPESATESAHVGAHAYIRKPVSVPALLDAVRDTVRSTLEWRGVLERTHNGRSGGKGPLPVDLGAAVTRLKQMGRLSRIDTITAWRLLWGDTNREIAQVLGCTERTAKFHVAEVLARTGARSRTGLLRVLLEDAGVEDPWLERRRPEGDSAKGA